MRQTPPNSVAIAEPNQKERLKGLLAAMFHGHVDSFEFKDVTVKRHVDSIQVVVDHDRMEGGRLYISSTTVEFAYNWLDNKNDIYGDS